MKNQQLIRSMWMIHLSVVASHRPTGWPVIDIRSISLWKTNNFIETINAYRSLDKRNTIFSQELTRKDWCWRYWRQTLHHTSSAKQIVDRYEDLINPKKEFQMPGNSLVGWGNWLIRHLNRGISGSIKSILICLSRAERLVEVLPDPSPVEHRPHTVVVKCALVSPSAREAVESNLA